MYSATNLAGLAARIEGTTMRHLGACGVFGGGAMVVPEAAHPPMVPTRRRLATESVRTIINFQQKTAQT
jgi:hypothetical protein